VGDDGCERAEAGEAGEPGSIVCKGRVYLLNLLILIPCLDFIRANAGRATSDEEQS